MTQTQALRVMLSGQSVFLTGAPGAGKTYVLNQYIGLAKKQGKTLAVTASTGIAATHINGTTIHSWSGLGIRDELNAHDRKWLSENDRLRKRYNNTDVLIIDEVSMLHGARLDMINEVCKLLRKSDKPFGGLQVILVGDLFQLPPISRGSQTVDFAHTSLAWQELHPNICYIKEQHRQQGGGLLEVLQAMRQNDVEEFHSDMLRDRLGIEPDDEIAVTRLYSHNVDVETINDKHLAAIDSKTRVYNMITSGSAAKIEQLTRGLLAPAQLELKVGAEVMFVANNFAAGFVNGSRGQVVAFKDDLPVVKLQRNGKEIKVEKHTWTLEEDGKKRADAAQLPLRLAWAITIHKSQGMSLDAAQIDLSRSFTPGMGYVALSRVRDLDGLYLVGINRMAMQLHPDIHDLDGQLQEASAQLANITPDELPEIVEPEKVAMDDALFEDLKRWRMQRSTADKVPAYVIAHNTVLETISSVKPTSEHELINIHGFGPNKAAKYAAEILAIVGQYSAKKTSKVL
jgi:ATP-dependent DNA helicase PIF1